MGAANGYTLRRLVRRCWWCKENEATEKVKTTCSPDGKPYKRRMTVWVHKRCLTDMEGETTSRW